MAIDLQIMLYLAAISLNLEQIDVMTDVLRICFHAMTRITR